MARTRLRHSVPTHTRISAIKQQTPPQPAKYAPNEKRGISRSSKLNYPGKDSHCRKSIVTEAIDGQNAQQDDALFNPKSTDPELQRTEAGAISRDKTPLLEVFPANQEVSKQREPIEGGAGNPSGGSGSTSDKHQINGGGRPLNGMEVLRDFNKDSRP